MMKRFILLLAFLVGFVPAVLALSPVASAAPFDPLEGACSRPGGSDSAACNGRNTPITGPDGIIVKVTRVTATIAAAVAVVIIIVYGVMLTLSAGDSSKVTNARNGIIAAVVGLVVIGLSQAIVVFVVSKL